RSAPAPPSFPRPIPRPPTSTPFPYTTLFRSCEQREVGPESDPAAFTLPFITSFTEKLSAFQRLILRFADLPLILFLYAGIEKEEDRKSTRLNSSHVSISYAVFCLKKKNSITH